MGMGFFEFGLLQPQHVSQPDSRLLLVANRRAPSQLGAVVSQAFERPVGQRPQGQRFVQGFVVSICVEVRTFRQRQQGAQHVGAAF